MPYDFDPAACANCPHGECVEDRRNDPVRGRATLFRLRQSAAMNCTFGGFMPGTDNDNTLGGRYADYLGRFRQNAAEAGNALFGIPNAIGQQGLSKVEGDVFELLEAGALWAAAAAWNSYMDTGVWSSTRFQRPTRAVATPTRKVAIVKLPRGYDATLLFRPEIRADIRAHEAALETHGMELGLSSPDIVGVRLPFPTPPTMAPFLTPIDNLNVANLSLLEGAHRLLEGQVESSGFLLAVAVKRSTRSDRLYQPLFEANVLKYLIEHVLRGAAFRFYAHLNTTEGADVVGRYRAASLVSLIRGGGMTRAIDALHVSDGPTESAQSILDDLPSFP